MNMEKSLKSTVQIDIWMSLTNWQERFSKFRHAKKYEYFSDLFSTFLFSCQCCNGKFYAQMIYDLQAFLRIKVNVQIAFADTEL